MRRVDQRQARVIGRLFSGAFQGARLIVRKPVVSILASIVIVGSLGSAACGDSEDGTTGSVDTSASTNGTGDPSPPSKLPVVGTDGSTPISSGDAGEAGVGPTDDDGGGGGGGDGDSGVVVVPPGSCGTANPAKGFIASLTVRVGAANRTYALSVPAGYDGTRLYPLVFGFHGDGGNGAAYRSSFPIEAQGGTRAIFVWPNGTNNNNGHSFDQARNPPANADVSFFDAMITAISTTYCVDKTKVYAHGMSGGAYFVNQLGRWRTSALRALAPMSGGGPFGNAAADFDPATGSLRIGAPLAVFMVHGQNDGSVNIAEGMKSLTYWRAAARNTAGQAATTPSPCQRQNGGTKPVVFCSIPGLGHTLWTGSAAGVWQFFAAN